MCVCVYIYIYIYMHIHIYGLVDIYIYIYIYIWAGRPVFNPRSTVRRLKTWYLMPPYFTLSIIKYGTRISGAILGMEQRPLLHPGVAAIEKGVFCLPRLRSDNLYIYIYIYIYILILSTFR